jgi:hypothetical protein
MTPNELIAFLKSYGFQGSGLVVMMFVLWGILKSDWVSKKIGQLFDYIMGKKKIEDGINISHITNHNMFNYIDHWVHTKVPTIKFSSDYRTIVFRKYLTILLMKYRDNTRNYIISKVYEEMDESELWKSILSFLTNIVNDYESEMETMGIPKVIIEKMKEKNVETINLIIDLTESVCSCEFYDSDKNLLKIYSIQNILMAVLQNVISNSIAVCNSINGSLKGNFVVVGGKKIIEKEIDH